MSTATSTQAHFEDQLRSLDQAGNLRTLRTVTHDGKHIIVDGRRMLNLSSNDYLGLAADGGMLDTFLSDMDGRLPAMSSSSSRLLTGNCPEFDRLERQLAASYGTEAALTFNSGYNMNMGILPAVSDSNTLILADKLVHASLIDGLRLSAAKCIRYRHMDYRQLADLVEKYANSYARIIIVTESIFSMDGDVADLALLADIKKKHSNVLLYVDEAHAAGVRGAHGLGIAEEQGCIDDIDFLCGTFGKALCSVGAYVVCSAMTREYLINKMRPFIFTTALPPLNAAWTSFVWERLPDMDDRRRHLASISEKLRTCIARNGECRSQSHIVPLILGASTDATDKAERLQANGFYVLPLRPPTVPQGTSRLRLSLTAAISDEDVTRLIKELEK